MAGFWERIQMHIHHYNGCTPLTQSFPVYQKTISGHMTIWGRNPPSRPWILTNKMDKADKYTCSPGAERAVLSAKKRNFPPLFQKNMQILMQKRPSRGFCRLGGRCCSFLFYRPGTSLPSPSGRDQKSLSRDTIFQDRAAIWGRSGTFSLSSTPTTRSPAAAAARTA